MGRHIYKVTDSTGSAYFTIAASSVSDAATQIAIISPGSTVSYQEEVFAQHSSLTTVDDSDKILMVSSIFNFKNTVGTTEVLLASTPAILAIIKFHIVITDASGVTRDPDWSIGTNASTYNNITSISGLGSQAATGDIQGSAFDQTGDIPKVAAGLEIRMRLTTAAIASGNWKGRVYIYCKRLLE